MRTLIVGDVHGCREELELLLAECRFDASHDQLVMVGDLVAKGPDSAGVVRLLRSLGARAVMGNHDAALLAQRDEPMTDYYRRLVGEFGAPEWEWLEALPYYLELPEYDALVVHAGFRPKVPLEAQKSEHMITMRSIRRDGSVTKKLEEGEPWAGLWPGPRHVYFGHDAVRGLQRYPFATGLDTACVYGGKLTGVLLPERELVSVKAKQVYSEPGKTINWRQGNGISTRS